MKKQLFFTLPGLIFLMAIMTNCGTSRVTTPEDLGWKLAYQSYTFRLFTFEEGLEKASGLGLEYVEAYPAQELSRDNPEPTHYNSDDATINEMKQLLESHGIDLVAYGVVSARSEEEWKQIFDFARDMGVGTITANPNPAHLDFLEQMCEDYEIDLAIHNHPAPMRYYAPDSIIMHVSGRSQRIGACADIGHWVRSGLDPLESIKKLEGRIVSVHFKDLNVESRDAHDVPWGTGVVDVRSILQELKDQEFRGIISIEYEHNWENNVPEIEESIEYFNRIVAELD
jgi:sugar phosphate isomerase/epimerase